MAGNYNISYIIQLIDKMTPALSNISKRLKSFSRQIKYSSRNLKDFGSTLTKIGKSTTKLGKSISLKLSLPLGLLARKIFKAGMQMENTKVMFETMMGSTEKADKMLKQIFDTAKKTPFTEAQLMKNATLFLNFGVQAEKIIPTLKMLSDVSAGNSQRFSVLAYNLAQVASIGKLTATDLRSLRLAGFTPLKIISDETGISIAKLEKIMSKGGISFEQVSKAMKIATSEGGRFYKLSEKISKTASGKLNKAMKEMSKAFRDLGIIALPYLTKFAEALTKLIQKFNKLSPHTKKIVLFAIVFGAVLAPLLIILGNLLSVLGFLYISLGVLWTILGLVSTAIALLPISWLVGGFIALLLLIKPIKKFFGWVFRKLGLIKQKTAESMAGVSIMKLEDINANYRQTLDKTTTLNSNSKVDVGGMFTFANAPKGSSFKMTPMPKNSNANLGYNMSYAR